MDRTKPHQSITGFYLVSLIMALCALVMVAPHTHRWILWEASELPNVFPEFQAIVLFLPDYAAFILFGLMVVMYLGHVYAIDLQTEIWRFGPWLLLVLWMLIGCLWATYPLLALYAAVHVGIGVMVAMVVGFLPQKPILMALSLAGAVQSIIAILQIINQGAIGLDAIGEIIWYPGTGPYRGIGLTVHPNNLGGYLLVALFASIAWSHQTKHSRCVMLIGSLIFIGLLATLSRSAILAAGISVSFYYRHMIMKRWRIVIPLSAVVVIVFGVLLVAFGAEARLNITNRNFHFSDSWTVIQNSPFWGTGANNAMTQMATMVQPSPILLPVHNTYLFVWMELGVVGLLFFLLASRQALIKLNLWSACYLGLCVIMLFDYYLWGDYRTRLLLFWVVGMGEQCHCSPMNTSV